MSDAPDMLSAFLHDRDVSCPSCLYNLRGLTGTCCPECNQKLQLTVGLVDRRIGWFVFGLVGIAMALGFTAILLGTAGLMLVRSGGASGPPFREILPLLVGMGAEVVLLFAWIRVRPKLSAASVAARWGWAAGAVGVSSICVAWFLAIVR